MCDEVVLPDLRACKATGCPQSSGAEPPAPRLGSGALHAERREGRVASPRSEEVPASRPGSGAGEACSPNSGVRGGPQEAPPAEGAEPSKSWSSLAGELGEGCRRYLDREDAAAAAAAALLKRLGGAAGGPAAPPFAQQLPTPLFCRPLPVFCRTRRVRFDESLNTEHEVTPYAEVYGRHPRRFVFDKDMRMIAAAPGGFVSQDAYASLRDDEEGSDGAGEEAEEEKTLQAVGPALQPEQPQTEANEVQCQESVAQHDAQEDFLSALLTSLQEELELAPCGLHADRKYSELTDLEDNWETYLAAAWSAYDCDPQPVKQDADRLVGCASHDHMLSSSVNWSGTFAFNPLLMAAW